MNSEPIFTVDESISYEWCMFAVYEHPIFPGKYATAQGAGCSCDWFEAPTEEQLRAEEPLDRSRVHTELKNFLSQYGAYVSAGAAITYLERFQAAFREVAQ